jgi:hypothetical protein
MYTDYLVVPKRHNGKIVSLAGTDAVCEDGIAD